PKMEKVADGMAAFQLIVKGLKGGHSGMDINLGRGNANKLMNTLLIMTAQKFGVRLATINGGSLRNAIPRESFATVVVPADKADKMKKFVEDYNTATKEQYAETEPDLAISMEAAEMPAEVIDNKTFKNMLEAIAKYPNGVIGMSKDFEGTVETSSNLALVKFENGKIVTCSLQRGLVDELKDKLADDIRKILTEHGAKAESSGSYHGWKPNIDSPILATMKKVYNEKFGKEPKVMVIHAGLECGILGAKYPNWDMISFGPTLVHPHSPDEALLIESVTPFWEFLVETLKNVPEK
ncbi:MAG: M20/M25/M40 family metallo-hydrolase, partial [Bacteroidales bacterium]|nr:M20/M25/M40 family metallo-hydrolase [Bacteroidales bacterium]